jgi:hypothetical protein
VIDRPGPWGQLFDEAIATADSAGDLVDLGLRPTDGDEAYMAVNQRIIEEAAAIASSEHAGIPTALVIWEGMARTGFDATDDFLHRASKAGFHIREILTVSW